MKHAPTVKANSKELKGLGVNVLDVADYLDDAESIAKYLSVALHDPDPETFLVALSKVARARGMTKLAQATGLGRGRLHKALAPGGKPKYELIMQVLNALGVRLRAGSHTS